MDKNYMSEIAKMLGVELDEEFMIEDSDGNLIKIGFYKLTNVGCFYKETQNQKFLENGNGVFLGILQGTYRIRKLPWEPKYNDEYYYPTNEFKTVGCYKWGNSCCDLAYKEAGFVFRTKEECEAALPGLRRKYLENKEGD